MNEWSKESLEEMFGDNVIEQLTFLSGCTKHSYCHPSYTALNGYIVSYENLEKFAELIVRECVSTVENAENGYQDYRNQIEDNMRDHCVWLIKNKFGIEE